MVSLRRKKNTVTVEGGQRRSARLLALEEQKNENAAHTMPPMDALQSSNDGQTSTQKRGRKKKVRKVYKEAQHPEEVGPSSNGNTSTTASALQKHTDRIIEYILDVLELNDTNELFTMPDNVQINDYSERVKNPGDFATLRQKHKDGMYKTLEQFESDVYMVFRKAIASNATDSIPHREALCLQDQAKQVFQSLKNNRTYSELELSAWHQKYFNNRKRAARNDGNVRASGHAAQLQGSSRPWIHSNMKQSGMATNVAANGRTRTSNRKPSPMRKPQFKASSKPRTGKDSIECSTSCTEQRRCTYKFGSDSSESIFPMVYKRPAQLIFYMFFTSGLLQFYHMTSSSSLNILNHKKKVQVLHQNNSAPSYKASLMHFVKDAGPLARRAAENKCQEYAQREKSKSVPLQQRPYTLTDKSSSFPTFGSWCRNPNYSGTASAVSSAAMASTNEKEPTIFSGIDCSSLGADDMPGSGHVGGPDCKLETNELLRLFSLIGTPGFLERSKSISASSSSKVTEPDRSFNSVLSGGGAHTRTTEEPKQVVLSSMTQTGQCSRLEQPGRTSMPILPSWQSRLSESKALGQKGLAGPEPRPHLASKTSSSITLGFGEYASSGHPFRPSTPNLFRSAK